MSIALKVASLVEGTWPSNLTPMPTALRNALNEVYNAPLTFGAFEGLTGTEIREELGDEYTDAVLAAHEFDGRGYVLEEVENNVELPEDDEDAPITVYVTAPGVARTAITNLTTENTVSDALAFAGIPRTTALGRIEVNARPAPAKNAKLTNNTEIVVR